jgi:hypothetical protein
MTPNQTNTNTGDLGQLDTAPLLAFLFSKTGEEGLRQCLEPWTEPETDPSNASAYGKREMLEDAANELQERGLSRVSAILLDIALRCPSGLDNVPSYYRSSYGDKAVEMWCAHWVQNRERQLGIFEDRLRHKLSPNARQS